MLALLFSLTHSLGMQLTDALDELIQSGHINPVLAMRVLTQFDRTIAETLTKQVKAKATLKGHLHTYRLCDDVWQFETRDSKLKLDNGEIINVERARIVACKKEDSASSK
ncbi:hypothetical protein L7F22_019064 [Adiantum nelumboides]|nr:hypothetical protein [Adiantum nelumboides]